MRRSRRVATAVALISLLGSCDRVQQRRHEFGPVHVTLVDGGQVSFFAHGSWSQVRTADSTYSLRGTPFTFEIQVRSRGERVTGGALTLRDSAGATLAVIEEWRIVSPSPDAQYSLLVVDSIPLPYRNLHVTGTLVLTSESDSLRSVQIDTLLIYRYRTSNPRRFFEVIRGL